MSLFGDSEGKIVALSETGFPAIVTIGDLTGQTQILLTSVGFGQGANVQFMHTLKDAIYVYAFGERMGTVRVSGLLLARSCDAGGSYGVTRLMRYYRDNTVSLNGGPVKISVSRNVLKGFLLSIEIGSFNAEMGTAKFTLTFGSLPMGS